MSNDSLDLGIPMPKNDKISTGRAPLTPTVTPVSGAMQSGSRPASSGVPRAVRDFAGFMNWHLNRVGAVEIRIMGSLEKSATGAILETKRNFAGYFDKTSKIYSSLFGRTARSKVPWNDHPRDGESRSIYFTLNQFDPGLLGRCYNKISSACSTTSDSHVERYRLLLIDVDAANTSGTSSTNEQKRLAAGVLRRVYRWLKQHGISSIPADSGNAWHLLIPVDFAADNSTKEKYRALLTYLQRFDSEHAHIDQTVYNPARISKLYWTKVQKGDPDRPGSPWRRSGIHWRDEYKNLPDFDIFKLTENVVDYSATIQAVASPSKKIRAQPPSVSSGNFESQTVALRDHLTGEGIVFKELNKPDMTIFTFAECPLNPAHNRHECSVGVLSSGAFYGRCMHDDDAGWSDFRDAIGFKPPKQKKKKRNTPQRVTVQTTLTPDIQSIRAVLWEISDKDGLSREDGYEAMSHYVVSWLHTRGRFFHDESRDFAGCMFFDSTNKSLRHVKSDAFRAWLSDALMVNVARPAFKFIDGAVQTEALSSRSSCIMANYYWSATNSAVYITSGPGRVIRVSDCAIDVCDNGVDNMLFPDHLCLDPWEITDSPEDPFRSCSLFSNMSTAADHGRLLFQLWAMTMLTYQPTRPPLCLGGCVGSGKTRTIRGLCELYGAPERILRAIDRGEGDFWTAINSGGLVILDNADTKIDWLADSLATASTNGVLEKRKLYTDSTQISLRSRASVCVTSSNATFAGDAGLADRLIVVRLNRRTGDTAEVTLSAEIKKNRDNGMTWVCQILQKALSDNKPVPTGLNSRHPDFGSMAYKIGRAMGLEYETLVALKNSETDKSRFSVENDYIGGLLLETVGEGFEGTATELCELLASVDPKFNVSSRSLGKRLSRIWPHLEAVFGAVKCVDSHTKQTKYLFAGFAGFKQGFSTKVPHEGISKEVYVKTHSETPQTPQDPKETSDIPTSDDEDVDTTNLDSILEVI